MIKIIEFTFWLIIITCKIIIGFIVWTVLVVFMIVPLENDSEDTNEKIIEANGG